MRAPLFFALLAGACATPGARVEPTAAVPPAPAPDAGTAAALPPPAPPPVPEDLLAKAQLTRQHLSARDGFTLTTVHRMGEFQLRVAEAVTPTARRMDFIGEVAGQRHPMATLVMKDDRWEIAQSGQPPQLTRPYEAVLDFPLLYNFITPPRATVVDEGFFARARFLRFDGKRALYAVRLPDAAAGRLKNFLAQAGQVTTPEAQARVAGLKQLLADGLTTEVDPETGIVNSLSGPRQEQVVTFDPAAKLDESVFSLGSAGEPPAPLTAQALGQMVLIAHQAGWQKGMDPGDLETELLDVKTGALRRVPVKEGEAMPGSFVPDRTKVVVAVNTGEGSIRPMEVNLLTGENRWLGGDELATGSSLFPVVSPDGKSAVVSHLPPDAVGFESQLYLIDLKTGAAQKLGEPMDHAFVSWLPGKAGLLLLRRVSADAKAEPKKMISRVSLKGEVQPVVEGNHPVLLADGKTLLFQAEDKKWKTCSLTGKDVKDFGDGFTGYGSPSPSPDGKQLVMIHFDEDGPRPVRVELKDKSIHPLTDAKGLFAYPSWR